MEGRGGGGGGGGGPTLVLVREVKTQRSHKCVSINPDEYCS